MKIYREREEKHISLLKGAEKQISKTLDQLNVLYAHNIKLGNENRKILKNLLRYNLKILLKGEKNGLCTSNTKS